MNLDQEIKENDFLVVGSLDIYVYILLFDICICAGDFDSLKLGREEEERETTEHSSPVSRCPVLLTAVFCFLL